MRDGDDERTTKETEEVLHDVLDKEADMEAIRAAEHRLAASADGVELRRAAEAVEAALRRAFEPGEPQGVPAIDPARTPGPIGRIGPGRLTTAAAILALGATVAFVTLGPLGSRNGVGAGALYAALDSNFVPTHVCDTRDALIAYTSESLGVPLVIENGEVRLVGWRSWGGSYAGTGNPDAEEPTLRVLLAVAEGGERVIAAFAKDRDDLPSVGQSDGDALRHFDSEVGGIFVREITPLPEPIITGRVELAR